MREILERLTQEVVALRSRVAELETQERSGPRVESYFVPARQFAPVGGSPTFSVVNGSPAWVFNDNEIASVYALIGLPENYVEGTTINQYHWWMNPSTNVGAIAWRRNLIANVGAGESKPSDSVVGIGNFDALGQYIFKRDPFFSNHLPEKGKWLMVGLSRNGNSAVDTLPGPICWLGLEIVYTAT